MKRQAEAKGKRDRSSSDDYSQFQHGTWSAESSPADQQAARGDTPLPFSPVQRNIFRRSPPYEGYEAATLPSPPKFGPLPQLDEPRTSSEPYHSPNFRPHPKRGRYPEGDNYSRTSTTTPYPPQHAATYPPPPESIRRGTPSSYSYYSQQPALPLQAPSGPGVPSFDSYPQQHPAYMGRPPPPPPPPMYSMGHPPPGYYGGGGWGPPPPMDQQMESIVFFREYKKNDVLCGRGGATNGHSGNIAFRRLVKKYQEKYITAKKRDKPSVAAIIVDIIREKSGRFLKQRDTPHGKLWYDIGDEKANEKTCQALREGAPARRQRLSVTKSTDSGDIERTDSTETAKLSPTKPSLEELKQAPPEDFVDDGAGVANPAEADIGAADDSRDDPQGDDRKPSPQQQTEAVAIQPHQRLMRRRIMEVSIEEFNAEERDMYLREFLPPHPPLRRGPREPYRVLETREWPVTEEINSSESEREPSPPQVAEV